MSVNTRLGAAATIDDFLAIDAATRFHELLAGEIVEKAPPSGAHGCAQGRVASRVCGPYDRRAVVGRPGGWWCATSVEVRFGDDVCCPDVLGWRRDRLATMPAGEVVGVIPDWICEVLSKDNARNDLVRKKHIYHQHRVGHYWILDPDQFVLLVYRWVEDGYLEVLSAERGQTVRAEPFGEIELAVGVLFGDDDE